MSSHDPSASYEHDIIIVGAGTVGLVLAIGLARAGFSVALIGPAAPARPGRTVALLDGSVKLLQELGLWSAVAARAAPLAHMRIVDATESLFRTAPVQFDAAEIGFDCFGYNLPNDELDTALVAASAQQPGLVFVRARAADIPFGPTDVAVNTDHGERLRARLLVAADGRQSLARKLAGIGVRTRTWPQVALTAVLRHDVPHGDVSTEFHTRRGPFTLVPLPDGIDGSHHSSLVWVMDPADARQRRAFPDRFAALVEAQSERLLGTMRLASDIGAFPLSTSTSARLTGDRLVLVGEAAHALPPIGAQGLNLSLRDVAALIDVLTQARRNNANVDIGARAVLDRYAARRTGDVAVRTLAVDALNGSLLARSPVADLARGLGLMALSSLAPLRRTVMRHGLVPGASAINRRHVRADGSPRQT